MKSSKGKATVRLALLLVLIAVAGFFGCRAVSFALPALTTLSVFMSHAFVPFLISLVVAFGLAFVFTMMVAIPDLNNNEKEI